MHVYVRDYLLCVCVCVCMHIVIMYIYAMNRLIHFVVIHRVNASSCCVKFGQNELARRSVVNGAEKCANEAVNYIGHLL